MRHGYEALVSADHIVRAPTQAARSVPARKSIQMSAPHSIMVDKIRDTLRQYARLNRDVSAISEDADLYAFGLTSHATVNLMLGLEDAFQLEFPERMLRRRTFETIANIRESIEELSSDPPTSGT